MEGETDTAFTGKPLQANIVILMTPYTGFPTPGSLHRVRRGRGTSLSPNAAGENAKSPPW